MNDREKVIKGLECCVMSSNADCKNCPYDGVIDHCAGTLMRDAFALLKAQEPRVMTLEDIRVIYHRRENHVWPFDTPPYLWVETNGRTVPYWMSWNNVIACQEGRFPRYDPDDYGKSWRCWTSCPTDAQREAEPWNVSQI